MAPDKTIRNSTSTTSTWNTAPCRAPRANALTASPAELASGEAAHKLAASGSALLLISITAENRRALAPGEAARIIRNLRESSPAGRLDAVASISAAPELIQSLGEISKWCAGAGIAEFIIAKPENSTPLPETHRAALGAWAARALSKGRIITLDGISPGDIFTGPGGMSRYFYVTSGSLTAVMPDPIMKALIGNSVLRGEPFEHHELLLAAARLDPQNVLPLILLLQGSRNAARLRRFAAPNVDNADFQQLETSLRALGFDTVTGPPGGSGAQSSRIGAQHGLPSLPLRFTYIARPPLTAAHIARLDETGQHTALGEIYGYPKCCIEENEKARAAACTFNIDFMLRIIANAPGHGPFPFVMNPAMNTHLVHFPCSPACAESLHIANSVRAFHEKHYPAVNAFAELKLAGSFIFTSGHVLQSKTPFTPGREYLPGEILFHHGAPPTSAGVSIEVDGHSATLKISGGQEFNGLAAVFQ